MTPKSPAIADIQVGANIRQIRVQHKMSQETLAGHLSITFQQVQKYEKGTNRVSASRLVEIARVFGVSMETLFTGVVAAADNPDAALQQMSRETLSLANDFDKIPDPKIRTSIRGLVKSLSNPQSLSVA
ncbi:helix-turn-helix transcriptional regulator [Agrobacterium tumefaciens]